MAPITDCNEVDPSHNLSLPLLIFYADLICSQTTCDPLIYVFAYYLNDDGTYPKIVFILYFLFWFDFFVYIQVGHQNYGKEWCILTHKSIQVCYPINYPYLLLTLFFSPNFNDCRKLPFLYYTICLCASKFFLLIYPSFIYIYLTLQSLVEWSPVDSIVANTRGYSRMLLLLGIFMPTGICILSSIFLIKHLLFDIYSVSLLMLGNWTYYYCKRK